MPHRILITIPFFNETILSEFPELCGLEQELINRSTEREMAGRFIQLMGD